MDTIYKEYSKKLPLHILDEIKNTVPSKITKEKLKKILEAVLGLYLNSKITSGEAVGLVAAESIGEQGTQMTLNVKHFSGVAELSVATGLPRLIEVLDGRKTLKTPMTEIYLKKPLSEGKGLKEFALSLKEQYLGNLISEFSINVVEQSLEITFNQNALSNANLTDKQVVKNITKTLKDFKLKLDNGVLTLVPKGKDINVNLLYLIKEKLKNLVISGVKGITQVLPVKKNDEYMVITAGSNLKEILQIPEVDSSRTFSNDLYEIRNILGVEAARQAIINEVVKVIENQGLQIDLRHIMLIADTMTYSGEIKGITRYGVVSEKSSVLARASFETPIKHIINAALVGEEDKLSSVVENVMVNQTVPIGTGLPGLRTTIK